MTLQALFDQALGFHQHGHLAEAERLYRLVLNGVPRHFGALHMLGVACAQQDRHAEALALIGAALESRPGDALALTNHGNVLAALGRFSEALNRHDESLAAAPDNADAWNNRGNALKGLDRPQEALASYDRALALRPGFADALSNRGTVLHQMGRSDDALASFAGALAADPAHVGALYNRGHVLHDAGRLEEAVAGYDHLLTIAPGHADALANRALCLTGLGRVDEALDCFDRAIAADPGHAEAHFNKGLCLMLAGRLDEGLPLYEWRKKLPVPVEARTYAQPLWTGAEDIAGKTLFVHIEQGLGDTIQFYRYAAQAAARGAKVVLAVQDRLLRLLASAAPAVRLIGYRREPEAFDYHIPLMSLPLALGIEYRPIALPYLRAEPERVKMWRERIGAKGLRIGVGWEGNRTVAGGAGRAFPPSALAGIARIAGVRLIGLQKDAAAGDLAAAGIESPGADFDAGPDAFLDSAAVMENLDLVIGPDATIAHLAGALGRPVWIALKHVPEWRWGLAGEDCPWYPDARLFRQKTDGDWASVFSEMEAQIGAMMEGR